MTGKMTPRSFVARFRDLVPGATIGEGTIFAALWQSRGRTVPYEVLADRYAMVIGTELHNAAVRQFVKKLRVRLAAASWPVKVTTMQGTGYALKMLDPSFDPFVPGRDDLQTFAEAVLDRDEKGLKFTIFRGNTAIASGSLRVDRPGDIDDAVDGLAGVTVPD